MSVEKKLKDFLSQKGVIAYRKIKWNNIKKEWVKKEVNIDSINLFYLKANFNTQVPGGTAIFFKKDNIEYYFGLKVFKGPPVFELS